MKRILLALALLCSTAVYADCSMFQRSIERHEARMNDPTLRIASQYAIEFDRQHLKECVAMEKQFAEQEAWRAKFPKPRIGQRKQQTNWGYPNTTSVTTTPKGTIEIQFFPGGFSLMYVNGVLESIHEVK